MAATAAEAETDVGGRLPVGAWVGIGIAAAYLCVGFFQACKLWTTEHSCPGVVKFFMALYVMFFWPCILVNDCYLENCKNRSEADDRKKVKVFLPGLGNVNVSV